MPHGTGGFVILESVRLPQSLIAAAAVALAVSSCTGPAADPPASPSTPQTPPATPSAAASPSPESAAADIVFRADSIVVVDDDGAQLATASLVTEREELVDVIAEALGEDPAESAVPVMNEQRAGMSYDWDGLSVYLADGEWPDLTADILQIAVTAPSINGVGLRTGIGISVGSAAGQLEPEVELGTFDGLSYYRTESVVVGTSSEAGFPSDPQFSLEWSVAVVTDGTVVTRFNLPSTNYGV